MIKPLNISSVQMSSVIAAFWIVRIGQVVVALLHFEDQTKLWETEQLKRIIWKEAVGRKKGFSHEKGTFILFTAVTPMVALQAIVAQSYTSFSTLHCFKCSFTYQKLYTPLPVLIPPKVETDEHCLTIARLPNINVLKNISWFLKWINSWFNVYPNWTVGLNQGMAGKMILPLFSIPWPRSFLLKIPRYPGQRSIWIWKKEKIPKCKNVKCRINEVFLDKVCNSKDNW